VNYLHREGRVIVLFVGLFVSVSYFVRTDLHEIFREGNWHWANEQIITNNFGGDPDPDCDTVLDVPWLPQCF